MVRSLFVIAWLSAASQFGAALVFANDELEFFEAKVRPLLVARCYECHKSDGEREGGLALDTRDGWSRGGDGGPAAVPGDAEASRLVKAVRWTNDELRMPPSGRMSDTDIAVLEEWIRRGAYDPREGASTASASVADWDEEYHRRLEWWSLKRPVDHPTPAAVGASGTVDAFLLSKLQEKNLRYATGAERRVLARRLSFALRGLPPTLAEVDAFVADDAADAYERLVEAWLASPAFGERWARRWMDVVHYADSHGYEWDVPAKGAWLYRDYLVRAFNDDVSFRTMILEQIAGDLTPRRIVDGLDQTAIGPMALRLGERRHGDNGEFEGVTQESLDNVVDTLGKAYLATTVACAHCHDHKYDAVAQSDYYSWLGVFASTRWVSRTADASDPPAALIAAMRDAKTALRPELARVWSAALARESLVPTLLSTADSATADFGPWKPVDEAAAAPHVEYRRPWGMLRKLVVEGKPVAEAWKIIAAEYAAHIGASRDMNRANLRVVGDFTHGETPPGWTIDGWGARTGFAHDGDFVVAEDGNRAVRQVVSAGLYSHLFSPRWQGAVRGPQTPDDVQSWWVELTGGHLAAGRSIVDHALFPENSAPLDHPYGTIQQFDSRIRPGVSRRIYFELVTKGLNNNFPPRVGLPGADAASIAEPRSWFGVSRVCANHVPMDEMTRYESLFAGDPPETMQAAAERVADWAKAAVVRFGANTAAPDDSTLLNQLLRDGVLPNDIERDSPLATAVTRYRALERTAPMEHTVGTCAEVNEGRDERIGIRGSYTDLGAVAPRGNVRFLREHVAGSRESTSSQASGRLELAQQIASDDNPLTARVYVNRVWQALFGDGLVRTADDFGRLGETPSHPELLDHLAVQFMADGWSTKALVREIVLSDAWRQSGDRDPAAITIDPENRLRHHMPPRRLEAEELRDQMLAVSGRLDRALTGPPIDPWRRAQDDQKRLFSGPLDGLGRRSLYTKVTLMELGKFFVEFNQPLPKLTTGRRDVTNVPGQALAMLNDPLVADQARVWAERVVRTTDWSVEGRVRRMFAEGVGREPALDEASRWTRFVYRAAELRGVAADQALDAVAVWQDVAHALFNMKEFVYVR